MVHDDSMLPTLRPGDRLLVDRRAYRDRPPQVGEIVVLVDPELPARWLVKRVAGVGPGRYRRTAAGITPTGPERSSSEIAAADSLEAIDLEGDMVYVTGDAPGSRDSRVFGPVPYTALVGRAYRCYAPPGRERDL
jgi:signal peptidase I